MVARWFVWLWGTIWLRLVERRAITLWSVSCFSLWVQDCEYVSLALSEFIHAENTPSTGLAVVAASRAANGSAGVTFIVADFCLLINERMPIS